jgi:16S rRNA (guanine966-N2)-methyltransferase
MARALGRVPCGRRASSHAGPGARNTVQLAAAARRRRTLRRLVLWKWRSGLEALSRGAASCLFIDHSTAALTDLRANITRLKATGAEIVLADVPVWLRDPGAGAKPFDIVFLDPPYRLALAEPCLAGLASSTRVAGGARVYVETATDEPPLTTPRDWVLHRDKRAGQVAYRLFVAASR